MIIATISLIFLLSWIGFTMWFRLHDSDGICEAIALGCVAAFFGMLLVGFALLLIYLIIAGFGGML